MGCDRDRCRRRRHDVRRGRGPARRPRSADRPCRTTRREDPHLRRRPLQLHQRQRRARQLHFREPGLLPLGARPLRRRGLHRAREAAPDPLPREAQGATVLRRLVGADHPDARRGVRRRPRAMDAPGQRGTRRQVRRCLRGRHGRRRPGGAPRRDRHRRLVDSEDRRDRLRLPHRAPVRPAHRRAAAGPRAADVRRARLGAFRAAGRRLARGERPCDDGRFDEDLLFTHRGLSGPAILQVSTFWRRGEPIEINLAPRFAGEDLAGN